jgi:hypothetical protein
VLPLDITTERGDRGKGTGKEKAARNSLSLPHPAYPF